MGRYKGKYERGAGTHEHSSMYERTELSGAGAQRRDTSRPSRQNQPAQSNYKRKPAKKKSKMPTAVRVILILLLIVMILAGAALTYVYFMLGKIDRSEFSGDPGLNIADLLANEEITDTEDSTEALNDIWSAYEDVKDMPLLESGDHIINYLLIGSDRRDKSSYGNSDSMIIVTLNKETKKIHLTSLMRAIYVIMPEGSGHTDGMLNWSYAWGGPELLMETIENNFKIKIDHYVTVDFSSFEQVVDAVGGVEITLTSAESEYVNSDTSTWGTYAGTQTLNGAQALSYARCRKLDNDFKRTHRQRDVIEALIRKVGNLSIGQLQDLANVLLPALSTDMSNTAILAELVNVPEYATYPIDQRMLPIENEAGDSYVGIIYKYGAEMYSVDWNTNLPALQEFISG